MDTYNAMRQAMQRFVDRVDAGEVRSKRTYAEFKEILSATPAPVAGDAVSEIVKDIRHSAKVDDYEIAQIAFLESVADRLAALAQDRTNCSNLEQPPTAKIIEEVPGIEPQWFVSFDNTDVKKSGWSDYPKFNTYKGATHYLDAVGVKYTTHYFNRENEDGLD